MDILSKNSFIAFEKLESAFGPAVPNTPSLRPLDHAALVTFCVVVNRSINALDSPGLLVGAHYLRY